MFSKFKNKDHQNNLQSNPTTPPKQLISSNPQQNQFVPQLITPKETMFKGSLKVKTQLQTIPQSQSNLQQITQDTYQQTNTPIVSIDDSTNNLQTQIMEFPQDQHNVDQNVEIKIDVCQVKKTTSSFSFLQKTKQETSQSTDESTQDQNESFIACGMNSQQNSTQIYPQDQIVFSFQNNDTLNYTNEINQQLQVITNHPTIEKQDLQKVPDSQNQKNLIQNLETQINGSHLEQYQKIIKQLSCFQQEQNKKKSEIFLQQQKIESLISLNYQTLNDIHLQLTKLSQTFTSSEQLEISSLQEEQVQIQKIEKDIKIYEFEFNNFQNQKLKLKSEEQIYYQITEQQLNEIEKQHIKYIDQYQQENTSTIKRLWQLLDEENERLKIQQIHIDIDYKHLDEEEQHLNQIMDNQTKDYRMSQDLLLQKKFNLNSEIAQLQLTLNQKILELQLSDQELSSTKDKIQQVQQKFHQQLGKVQIKRTKLLDELKGLTVEKIQIENQQNEFITKEQDYKQKLQDLQDSLNIIKEQRSNLIDNVNMILQNYNFILNYNINYLNQQYQFNVNKKLNFSVLQELQQVQRQIDGLNYQRSMSQQQLHEILNQKSDLQIKLPKMIDSKAQFVQNKNFKGAAQINEQIKEVQKQIILFENNISQNQSKESQLLKQIDEIEDILLTKQQQFKQLNQITEVLRYQFQELKLKQIVQLDYKGLSPLIQEIRDELNLLYNKNEDILNINCNYSQDIPQDIFEKKCIEQNNLKLDNDIIHKEYIHNQENEYPEIQQQIQQLKEKVFKYAQEEQFQEAHQIQQQINQYQNEALRLNDGVKKRFEIDLREKQIH